MAGSALGPLTTSVDVIISDDVILAQVGACLHLYQNHVDLAGVFQPVNRAQGNVDRLVFGNQAHIGIDGHFCSTFHHDPMFGAVVMALQA